MDYIRESYSSNNFELTIVLMILTLLLPFFLIIIEQRWLPYPAIVEEIIKFLVIYCLILKIRGGKYRIWTGVMFGFLFGLMENIFYLINAIHGGNIIFFWQRMLLIIPMHIATVMITLCLSFSKKNLMLLGLILASISHHIFNLWMGKI